LKTKDDITTIDRSYCQMHMRNQPESLTFGKNKLNCDSSSMGWMHCPQCMGPSVLAAGTMWHNNHQSGNMLSLRCRIIGHLLLKLLIYENMFSTNELQDMMICN